MDANAFAIGDKLSADFDTGKSEPVVPIGLLKVLARPGLLGFHSFHYHRVVMINHGPNAARSGELRGGREPGTKLPEPPS